MVVTAKKILLVGANGMLAHMVRKLAPTDVDIYGIDLPEFDLTDPAQVKKTVAGFHPDIIINCAAYTDVDGCESNVELAMQVNAEGVGYLAVAAYEVGVTLVHISTDYVFSGETREPYTEESIPDPQSVYGRSKLAGEQAILDSSLERYFIIRTSWLYGPNGKNFIETMLRLATEREKLKVVSDQIGAPTFTEDLTMAIFHLLATESYGIYHFSNSGTCNWYDFAVEIIKIAKQQLPDVKVKSIQPIRTEEYPLPAKRPAWSVFSKVKYIAVTGFQPPDWQDGLKRYFDIRESPRLKEK